MGVRMVRDWIFGLIPGILLSMTGVVLSGCERGSTSGQPPNDVQGQIVDSRRTALVKAVERVAPTVVGILSVGHRRASSNELRRELLGGFFHRWLRSRKPPGSARGSFWIPVGFF